MKKVFLLSILFLMSCASAKKEAPKEEINPDDYKKDPVQTTLGQSQMGVLNVTSIEDKQDYYYDIKYPKVESDTNPNLASSINNLISSMIENYKADLMPFESIITDTPYFDKNDPNSGSVETITLKEIKKFGDLESYIFTETKQTVGANGYEGYEVVTFNTKTDQPISIDQLSKEDDESQISADFLQVLYDEVLEQVKQNSPDVLKSLKENTNFAPESSSFSKFAIDDNFLYIYYSEIELLDHAHGVQVFEIPIDKIRNFLSDDLFVDNSKEETTEEKPETQTEEAGSE